MAIVNDPLPLTSISATRYLIKASLSKIEGLVKGLLDSKVIVEYSNIHVHTYQWDCYSEVGGVHQSLDGGEQVHIAVGVRYEVLGSNVDLVPLSASGLTENTLYSINNSRVLFIASWLLWIYLCSFSSLLVCFHLSSKSFTLLL